MSILGSVLKQVLGESIADGCVPSATSIPFKVWSLESASAQGIEPRPASSKLSLPMAVGALARKAVQAVWVPPAPHRAQLPTCDSGAGGALFAQATWLPNWGSEAARMICQLYAAMPWCVPE